MLFARKVNRTTYSTFRSLRDIFKRSNSSCPPLLHSWWRGLTQNMEQQNFNSHSKTECVQLITSFLTILGVLRIPLRKRSRPNSPNTGLIFSSSATTKNATRIFWTSWAMISSNKCQNRSTQMCLPERHLRWYVIYVRKMKSTTKNNCSTSILFFLESSPY